MEDMNPGMMDPAFNDPDQEVASSAPTDDNGTFYPLSKLFVIAMDFDSDAMLDPPIQNVGDNEDITHD